MTRHRLDAVALGFGLIFLYVVVLAATDSLDVGGDAIGWLVPGVLAITGLCVGLGAMVRATQGPDGAEPTGSAGAIVPAPTGGRELDEPWARFVHDADQAAPGASSAPWPAPRRPSSTTGSARSGTRITAGVDEVVRVAARGQTLARARAQLDPDATIAELGRAEAELAGAPDNRHLQAAVESLHAQLGSSERLAATVEEAGQQLRVFDVRLNEAVARAIELSVGTLDESGLRGLDHDVDDIVDELEALRLALDDTNAAPAAGAAGVRAIAFERPASIALPERPAEHTAE